MNVKNLSRLFVILLITILLSAGSERAARGQGEIKVAVATNFSTAMDEIADRYEKLTGTAIKRSTSATGILYAQIINSAPFDLFLAADEQRPALLYQHGLCGEPFTYATGNMVLWSGRNDLDEAASWHQTVLRHDIRRIALANPETAPYGAAAVQAMNKRGVEEKVRERLVYGQNVGQAFQYARQGSADIAFVARSYALSELGAGGKTWPVPEAMPVIQDGCMLNRTAHRKEAQEFIAYLQTAEARTILAQFGYE